MIINLKPRKQIKSKTFNGNQGRSQEGPTPPQNIFFGKINFSFKNSIIQVPLESTTSTKS